MTHIDHISREEADHHRKRDEIFSNAAAMGWIVTWIVPTIVGAVALFFVL